MLNKTLVFDAIVIVLFTIAIASIAVPSITLAQNMTEDDKTSSPEIAKLAAEENMTGV